MRPSPLVPSVDFEAKGKRHGHLRLPHSRDESAWGSVMIPITVAAGAPGPTALLTGGNHGDEYEGPLALFDLARALDPETLTGRVIIVPALNYPAFRAGTRTSPIDKGNLNRMFPGRPDGSVTEKIADFVTRELLPRADYVLDFHSGGRTLDFLPFAAAHVLPDKDQERRAMAAVAAFGAPFSTRMVETVAIARRGAANLLRHAGILPGAVEAAPTRWLDMPEGCFSFAPRDGLVETSVDLGAPVRAGEVIARIHAVDRTGVAPEEIRAEIGGLLAARHFPGLIQAGDCAAVIAVPA